MLKQTTFSIPWKSILRRDNALPILDKELVFEFIINLVFHLNSE